MSTQIIKVIPTDPNFVPTDLAKGQAQALLNSFVPQATMVEAQVYDAIRFVDQRVSLEHSLV